MSPPIVHSFHDATATVEGRKIVALPAGRNTDTSYQLALPLQLRPEDATEPRVAFEVSLALQDTQEKLCLPKSITNKAISRSKSYINYNIFYITFLNFSWIIPQYFSFIENL